LIEEEEEEGRRVEGKEGGGSGRDEGEARRFDLRGKRFVKES
jgi:hypothetical protein